MKKPKLQPHLPKNLTGNCNGFNKLLSTLLSNLQITSNNLLNINKRQRFSNATPMYIPEL